MTEVRRLDPHGFANNHHVQDGALDLARRLPSLVVAAKEMASSLMHGVHGRKRAGVGENFWQFRPFTSGESATEIDWRRSARDDRLYVREREWEAAHTIWLWMDVSPSMAYESDLALQSKQDRALVLGLALADLMVRGGERVGIPGLTRPMAARDIVERLALAMATRATHSSETEELPPDHALAPRAQAVLISDFLSDAEEIAARIASIASRGGRGHLVMIADPVEETFPFEGHTEFLDVDSPLRLRIGEARSFREVYLERLAAHRARLEEAARNVGWSFSLHRTDRPASTALLHLRGLLEAGGAH